jgi:hypothetical protein
MLHAVPGACGQKSRFGGPMKTPKKHVERLVELKLVSEELNKMLEDGSFYRLSFASRWAWIRRVKKLYNGLRGPIADFNLKPLLAAGALSAAALLATGCPAPGGSNTPAFAAPATNPFGLATVLYYSRPSIVDIDNDGDLDVLVGNLNGDILFFRNTGTASAPAFAAPATNPFNLTNVDWAATPYFVDIDNDGDLDAFVGNSIGDILYFQNTGTASAPAFAAPLTNPFGLVRRTARNAIPSFVDIDNDGDLDALIGGYDGQTFFFRNTGSASAPAFAAPVTDPFGLTGIGVQSSPCFVDIDNDGDLDAFIGDSYGNTFYFQNTGSVTNPVFAASVTNPFGLIDVGWGATPAFADIDNDGDLDGFFGNDDGNILFFRNTAR